MSGTEAHWSGVYRQKKADEVSWFQPLPVRSLAWIREVLPDTSGRIVDVGGGASTLVDELLNLGYSEITVVDVAAPALEIVRERLGPAGAGVELVAADLLDFAPTRPFDVWHDRAVLHFLREEEQQRRYSALLSRAVRPGGHAIIATFAVGGPTRCSGLEVVQYDAARIEALTGAAFELLRVEDEMHLAPSGGEQAFAWFLLRRRGGGELGAIS